MSMVEDKSELREIHWLMDMLQTLEVGVMVVRRRPVTFRV